YTKISEALQSSNRQSVLISSPESIYGLDLQKGEIPVFELNRSNIYSDDCIIQEGLSCEILKMVLTGRKILYVGYDQNYKGYEAVALALKNILGGDFVPLNNIVVADMPADSQLLISNENFSCLNLPIDDFVGRLIANKTFSKTFRYDGEESKFISDLFNIASTPTETQAIELFLKQLLEDVASDLSIDEIVRKANLNCENLKKIKGNFNAFVKCWQSIKKEIGESPTKRKLTSSVDAYQWRRKQITMGVQNQGEEYGIAPKRILLFSESLRVVEFLTGTSDEFQQKSSLFICECRPKSEYPFQDAKNMCALLKESGCRFKSITIIPDMAAFNLLERNLIDVVILGAHDVLFYEDNPVHFINTCGSSALIETAINNSIEVIVVAERGKFNTIPSTNESVVTESSHDSFVYAISYGHESTIYDDYEFMLWAENESIGTKNIGYDFCAFHKGMRLICEDEVFEAEESDLKIRLVDRTKD
ncbi:MAG: hypothetical protein K2M17_06255, partial [Bacilli bacterium]|nr:hypothetical protein [Bacilli bacterium]